MLTSAARPRGLGSIIGGMVHPTRHEGTPPTTATGLGQSFGDRLSAMGAGNVAPTTMQQPSRPDYAAILRGALGERPTMSTGQKIASIIGPALMAASGNEAAAMQMIGHIGARGRDWDDRAREADLTAAKWTRDDDIAERERNEPRYFASGRDQVRYDPATGQSTLAYDGQEDFQTYATAQGHAPGSDEYARAAQDYVLRGSGPTAFQYDRDLAAVKHAQAILLENARQANRSTLKGLPTYRDKNPLPRATSGSPRAPVVTVSTPAEAMKLAPGTKFRTQIGGKWVTKVRP